jgi:hypothetical protein
MIKIGGNYPVIRPCVNSTVALGEMWGATKVNPSPGLDPTVSIFVDNYHTELTLLGKQLCPEARIEATAEAFEDEDGHVRVYPPAGLRDEEIAEIE